LLKGQKLDPANPRHAALLSRAADSGIELDVDAFNNSGSNLVPVEVVDEANPTQKRKQFYNKATGQITDVGQSNYVQPVSAETGMTSAQEDSSTDRKASLGLSKERLKLAANSAQLAHDKFMWETTSGIPASAKRSFDVQTQPLQKELTSKLAEIKSWQQKAESNAVMPDVAEQRVAEIQGRVAELQTQIGTARDKALSTRGVAPRPLARRAAAPGAAKFTEQDVRARAKAAGRDEAAAVTAARAGGLIK
jgi:hypothetical protein